MGLAGPQAKPTTRETGGTGTITQIHTHNSGGIQTILYQPPPSLTVVVVLVGDIIFTADKSLTPHWLQRLVLVVFWLLISSASTSGPRLKLFRLRRRFLSSLHSSSALIPPSPSAPLLSTHHVVVATIPPCCSTASNRPAGRATDGHRRRRSA
jgi:hypothetical protein